MVNFNNLDPLGQPENIPPQQGLPPNIVNAALQQIQPNFGQPRPAHPEGANPPNQNAVQAGADAIDNVLRHLFENVGRLGQGH